MRKKGSKEHGGELESWQKGGEPMDIPGGAKNMEGFLGEKNRQPNEGSWSQLDFEQVEIFLGELEKESWKQGLREDL